MKPKKEPQLSRRFQEFEIGERVLYKTSGCMEEGGLCVNPVVIVNENKQTATIIGVAVDENAVKYTLRYENGYVDTGYRRETLALK